MGLALKQQPGLRGDRTSGVNVTPAGPGASVWKPVVRCWDQWIKSRWVGQPLAPIWLDGLRPGSASSLHPWAWVCACVCVCEEARASGWSQQQGDGGAVGSRG